MKAALLVTALLFFTPFIAIAEDWWEDDFADYPPITLELNAWSNQIDGTIQWGRSDIEGSEIDFRNDLGMDAAIISPYIRLNIGMAERWDLRLSFWHTRQEVTGELTDAIDFGGNTFKPDIETDTRFSMDAYTVLLGYKFIDGEQLDFTVLAGGGAYKARMEMENASEVVSEEHTIIPAPLVGVAMDIELSDTFTLRGQIVGMSMSLGEAHGEAFDAEAAITWTFYEGLYITGGYKLFRTDVEFGTDTDDDDAAGITNGGDFDIEGPFFGLGLVF